MSSPLLKKQIHSKALVFALFWAFPQLLPAQPSLRDPLLGTREARAGLPICPIHRPWALDSQCVQGHRVQPPGGVPGHVLLGLTGPKLHFCSETPCHLRTEAPQGLWDKTRTSEEGPGSFSPSGRATLPSRGLQGFGLLVDMDLEPGWEGPTTGTF